MQWVYFSILLTESCGMSLEDNRVAACSGGIAAGSGGRTGCREGILEMGSVTCHSLSLNASVPRWMTMVLQVMTHEVWSKCATHPALQKAMILIKGVERVASSKTWAIRGEGKDGKGKRTEWRVEMLVLLGRSTLKRKKL